MKAIRRFTVRAVLPEELSALDELAGNLRWSWYEPTRRVFAHVRPELWEGTGHAPVALLGAVDKERLRELAADEGFVAWAEEQRADLRAYVREPRWYQQLEGDVPEAIGYFSPEFGIAAALPQYSGGLGILAGDHLKSASDLGVPLVGVGLFYRSGYFRQGISSDGWQQETYPVFDPDGLPLQVLRDADGAPVHVPSSCPPPAPCTRGSGRRASAASRCSSSTPTCPRTTTTSAASPPGCTAAAASTACTRSCCSASAACARSPRTPASRVRPSRASSTPTRATRASSASSGSPPSWPTASTSTRRSRWCARARSSRRTRPCPRASTGSTSGSSGST